MKYEQLVYVIKSGEHHKIGISSDVDGRLDVLQTASPTVLECVAYYSTSSSARSVEAKLHKLFSGYRTTGEWFNFGDKDPTDLIREVGDKFGMKKLDFKECGGCVMIGVRDEERVKHFRHDPYHSTGKTPWFVHRDWRPD